LVPPHGGLSEPVCRTVPAEEKSAFLAEAAKLAKVPVSAADISTVYRWADGTLSPLTGPMNGAEFNRVLDEACIERGGKKSAWTIPLALPVTTDQAKSLKAGQKVALTSPAGEIVATLEMSDVLKCAKPIYLHSCHVRP